MYNLMIDMVKDMVIIELSGSLSKEQIDEYVFALQKVTNKYESKIFSIIILANRLHPIAQQNIPNFERAAEILLSWANKIAVVNGNRTLTLYQMKRIETEVRKKLNADTPVMRFRTRKEAFNFMLDCT